ncbi:MAG: sulfate adenylyltransferase subunit CysD [Sphingomonas sp.]|nr:sulfate adenylyltransferase subunit CysD [Sphingomonas sp.]RZV49532.1 MAG: sulfate adenylyltransferase subunit CysD [Sphingomonadaceae bacterium]
MGDFLDRLEAESIFILREAVAEAARPVMLYSLGKDSAVMLHLARKAFLTLPFPLLHVDTTWKFKAMYAARDKLAAEPDIDLIVHKNRDAEREGINPFDHGARHTELWKTEGLRQALAKHGFDVAFGGARRDEEKSRAKERIVSVRDASGNWDPRRQRPEPWNLFNFSAPTGETFRVFPLSHWTERDVWHYIKREQIKISPLYFAANRAVVERDGQLIMVDDDRFPGGDAAQTRKVRFRTLGCYPLTGAIESDADTLDDILAELNDSESSERAGRMIDREGGEHAMEVKKREGYF